MDKQTMEISSLFSLWTLPFVAVGLLYLYLTRNNDYWKKRGVPYVKPGLLFGNLKDSFLAKKTIGECYQEIYWKLDGYKYGGAFKFSQPELIIRDPELIKNILVKEFTSFHDNAIHVDLNTDPMFGRNPFCLTGEQWKITRAQLMPAFTVTKLKLWFPLVQEVCEELKEKLQKTSHLHEYEVKELCAQFTTNVVASCAFGINGGAIKDPESEFRRMGRAVIEPDFYQNMKILIIFFIPWLANLFKLRFITGIVEKFFRRIVEEVVEYREKNNVSRADYMQHLINLKNKTADNGIVNGYETAPGKNVFKDVDVAAQAITFFGDGFETSSAAMSFILYCLALNPDVQTRVREEVCDVLHKHGGKLTFDNIQEMTYLDMVFHETLRMYPPGMFITRECTRPFNLETPSGGMYKVEAGTPVVIPLYALHYDPQYHPNPDTFDPDRFSEENKKNINKYAYLPFGEGPRICLGNKFANMQVKTGIASLITNFEIRATKRTPSRVNPDPNYFMLAAKGGLWLQFTKLK